MEQYEIDERALTQRDIQLSQEAEDLSKAISTTTLSDPEFCQQLYDASHGFKTGAYLIPYPTESFYNYRMKISVLKNFFKPIIDAMVTPIFSRKIRRETEDVDYKIFIENADNSGTELDKIMENALKTALIQGRSFIVVDNINVLPNNQLEMTSDRLFPFVYIKGEVDAEDIVTDKFGKLLAITFEDGYIDINGKKYEQYRYYDQYSWCIYYEDAQDNEFVINEGVHNLGVVPVVIVDDFINSRSCDNKVVPPYYGIANLNYYIYNKLSQLRRLESTQSHSILQGQFNGRPFKSGVHNTIDLPSNATIQASFISPDATHHTNLLNSIKTDIDDLYAMAENNGIKLAAKSVESGISKAYDFQGSDAILRRNSKACERIEKQIANIFGLWINRDIEFEAEYPDNFGPTYNSDRIAMLTKVITDIKPTGVLLKATLKEIAKEIFKGEDDVIEEIDNELDMVVKPIDVVNE
jgi:hypothetical protein